MACWVPGAAADRPVHCLLFSAGYLFCFWDTVCSGCSSIKKAVLRRKNGPWALPNRTDSVVWMGYLSAALALFFSTCSRWVAAKTYCASPA